MTAADERYIRRAIALATENVTSGNGGPFGAVIVREGVVIAEGANQVTTQNDPTAHAEIVALRAACTALNTFELRGCTVYTSCEPCPMCLAAIYWARCEAIVYGNDAAAAARAGFDDAFLYNELKLPQSERSLPIRSLCADEAWASFAAWQTSPLKRPY